MNKSTLFAIALTALLAFTGCVSRNPLRVKVDTAQYSQPIRVACVGDSITYGSGIVNRERDGYPAVLGGLLGEKFDVKNFGIGGATLLKKGDKPYWDQAQFQQANDFQPDIVVIKLGTNDSKPQNWGAHGAEYAADLRSMVEHFQSLPSKPLIWAVLPVPVFQDRWGINETVVAGEVIPAIRQVADEMNIPLVDAYSALSNRPDYFPDGIHPNEVGAGSLAFAVYLGLNGR